MKKTKLLALFAVPFLLGGIASCGTSSSSGGSQTLRIGFVKLGYGDDFIKNIIKGYTAKTGVKVTLDERIGSDGVSALTTDLTSHASKNDLIFNKFQTTFSKSIWKQTPYTVKGTRYNSLFADLTDIWEGKCAETDTKTLKERASLAIDTFYNYDINEDGSSHYYGLPWAGGFLGIVRNETLWNKLGFSDETDELYTTNQLFALCDKVVAMNKKSSEGMDDPIAPFIYVSSTEYYSPFINIWAAQYEGYDTSVNKMLMGYDPDGNISSEYYTYDGQRVAIDTTQKLVSLTNKYQYAQETLEFTTAQRYFLTGEALFMVNGTWLENESGNASYDETKFIRTPVCSELSRKLSYFRADNANNPDYDVKLASLVKYVDALDTDPNAKAPEWATKNDIKIVTEARHFSYTLIGSDHQVVIPAYSSKIDLAKDFLKYMYSDEGLNIYYETMNGLTLPFSTNSGTYTAQLDMNKVSTFKKSIMDECNYNYFVDITDKGQFFSVAGVSCYYVNGCPSLIKAIRSSNMTTDAILSANTQWLEANINDIQNTLM